MDESNRSPDLLESHQNRRIHDRSTIQLRAICEMDDGTGSPYYCTVLVTNLSTHGASCIAPRSFTRGTTLRLELANAARTIWHIRSARVVHGRPTGEGNWIMGCHFADPLDDEQFRELVVGPRTGVY